MHIHGSVHASVGPPKALPELAEVGHVSESHGGQWGSLDRIEAPKQREEC